MKDTHNAPKAIGSPAPDKSTKATGSLTPDKPTLTETEPFRAGNHGNRTRQRGQAAAGKPRTTQRATNPRVHAGEDVKEPPRVIRMVACDLDGTLLRPGDSGIEPIKKVMKLLRSKNVEFTLATGRVFGSVEPLLKSLDLTGPVVTNGGAMVAAQGDDPLLEEKIQRAVATDIAEELRSHSIPFYYIVGKDMLTEWEGSETQRYSRGIDYPIEVVPTRYLNALEPTQIVVRVNPDKAERFVELYEKRSNPSVKCVRSLPHLVEFQAKGVSKASGLAFLSSLFGFPREEILAIGDGLNDLDMFKWAGVSGCVSNAHPKACDTASYVSNRPYAEGVLEIIEKFTMPV